MTVTEQTVSDSLLQELLAEDVPCGGVKALGIAPCGRAASLVLDRRHPVHQCTLSRGGAAFKCADCYGKWLDSTAELMAINGGILGCAHCREVFSRLSDFAHYVPL